MGAREGGRERERIENYQPSAAQRVCVCRARCHITACTARTGADAGASKPQRVCFHQAHIHFGARRRALAQTQEQRKRSEAAAATATSASEKLSSEMGQAILSLFLFSLSLAFSYRLPLPLSLSLSISLSLSLYFSFSFAVSLILSVPPFLSPFLLSAGPLNPVSVPDTALLY
jgi:hypothetical protein